MSAERVVIKPKTRSRNLQIGTEHYVEGTVNGIKRKKDLGNFDQERWAGTAQNRMPIFNTQLGRFALYKEDGTLYTQEEVDAWVVKYKLTYPKKHKKEGEVITHANIYDPDDWFLNHESFIKILKEGEAYIDKSSNYAEVIIAAVRGDKEVKHASSDARHAGNIKYILTDKDTDLNLTTKERENKLEAYKLYDVMDALTKKIILRALGRNVKDDEDPRTIDEILFSYVDDNVTRQDGLTRQKLFVKMAKMNRDELKLKDLIARGEREGHIRKQKGLYMFQGTPIGTSMQNVETFFQSPQNYVMYESLILLVDGEKLRTDEEKIRTRNLEPVKNTDEFVDEVTEEEDEPNVEIAPPKRKGGRPRKTT